MYLTNCLLLKTKVQFQVDYVSIDPVIDSLYEQFYIILSIFFRIYVIHACIFVHVYLHKC